MKKWKEQQHGKWWITINNPKCFQESLEKGDKKKWVRENTPFDILLNLLMVMFGTDVEEAFEKWFGTRKTSKAKEL